MALLDAFLPLIRRQISGPLDFMMTDAALDAAIVFCRESTLIQTEVVLDGVTPGQQYSLLDLSLQLRPNKILAVFDATNQPSDEWLGPCDHLPQLCSGTEYSMLTGNTIKFRKAYGRIRLLVSVEPVQGADEVPDILADEYAQSVAYGALERLYMMPGKPWTDEQRSAYYKARFTDGFREAYRQAVDSSPWTGFHNPVRRHEFI